MLPPFRSGGWWVWALLVGHPRSSFATCLFVSWPTGPDGLLPPLSFSAFSFAFFSPFLRPMSTYVTWYCTIMIMWFCHFLECVPYAIVFPLTIFCIGCSLWGLKSERVKLGEWLKTNQNQKPWHNNNSNNGVDNGHFGGDLDGIDKIRYTNVCHCHYGSIIVMNKGGSSEKLSFGWNTFQGTLFKQRSVSRSVFYCQNLFFIVKSCSFQLLLLELLISSRNW